MHAHVLRARGKIFFKGDQYLEIHQNHELQLDATDRPRADRPITYRGFLIELDAPHSLFRIVEREGFELPSMLSGLLTSFDKIKSKVDMYFAQSRDATAEAAYLERPKKRGRGRPRKIVTFTRSAGSST
jgi:hypothetical protein